MKTFDKIFLAVTSSTLLSVATAYENSNEDNLQFLRKRFVKSNKAIVQLPPTEKSKKGKEMKSKNSKEIKSKKSKEMKSKNSKSKKVKSSTMPKTQKSKSQKSQSKSCKSEKSEKSGKSDKSGKSKKCNPTIAPSTNISRKPTSNPTSNPSDVPTSNPSDVSTSNPSDVPTSNPSDVPTISQEPSAFPSYLPTLHPSSTPTTFCSSERGIIETMNKVAESISGSNVTGTAQVKALEWMKNLDPLPNVCIGGEKQTEVSQLYALAVFYYSTSGDNWNDNTMWLEQNKNVCDWYGISCTSGNVFEIKLEGNNLVGELPRELASISTLSNILFFTNELNGVVPDEIFSLELKQFDVEANILSGAIFPDKLFVNSAETIVEYLISKNKFTGTIPTDVGELLKLEKFWVGKNDLTGTIPSELANAKGLKTLVLYENSFTGSFPPDLFSLKNLTLFKAYNNILMKGPLPENIDSKKLTRFEIDNSGLTGKLPTNLGDLTSLLTLYLSNNTLTGTIPDLDDMEKLVNVTLNNNEFTGSIPKLKTKDLFYVDFSDNKLSGPIPENIFQVSSFPKLFFLYLSNNTLTGTIPSWDVAESKLSDIWLEGNQLTGTIPGISSENLPKITEILISENCLTGSVPDSICSRRDEYSKFKSLHVDCKPPSGSDIPRNQCAEGCCTSCFVGGVGCN